MNTFENSNGGLLGSDSHSGKGGAGNDLFALTDEQILEIGPESAGENSGSEEGQQDDHVQQEESGRTAPAQASHATTTAARKSADADSHPTQENSAAAVAVAAEPPTWLADLMADPQRGTEARALWQGVERERQEAAAYREVFAEPAAARAAAERARALDEIDRAYFAGDAVERSKLAATMLREDPAAFREMVLEGLRALDEAEKSGGGLRSAGDSRLARVFGGARAGAALNAATSSAPSTGADGTGVAGHHGAARRDAHQDAQMAAYASFEKSANEDLERSVGVAIDRTLSPALPNAGRDDDGALKSRLVGAVRHDVEKALQSDRQLSERVAQLLSGKRLNDDDAGTSGAVDRGAGRAARARSGKKNSAGLDTDYVGSAPGENRTQCGCGSTTGSGDGQWRRARARRVRENSRARAGFGCGAGCGLPKVER